MKTKFHVDSNNHWTQDHCCDRCHATYTEVNDDSPGYCPTCAELGKLIEQVKGVSRIGSIVYVRNMLGHDTELNCTRNGNPDVTGAMKVCELLAKTLAKPVA